MPERIHPLKTAPEPDPPQESIRFLREVTDERQRRKSGQATGSQRYAQIAPSPSQEQKYLAWPRAINDPIMQTTSGLIYAMADIDKPDDPCHPTGP